MPTILEPFGIKVPASDLEPPNGAGQIGDLGVSVSNALARPYVYLRASAATSIANSPNGTKVDLEETVHNDEDYFGVGSSIVTIQKDGLYRGFAWATGTTGGTAGVREAWIGKNGIASAIVDAVVDNQVTFGCNLAFDMEPLEFGDTLQLAYAQVSGAARNTKHGSGFYFAKLVVVKVG